ncbi:MAG: adenylate kinase [Candidatus Aerophobetes bacterium]
MRIVLLGPPGSGKGTQAQKLGRNLGLPHVGMGDMLREALKNRTSLGERAKEFMDSGKLVPDSIILELLGERLEGTKEGFILDGFPRTLEQAKRLGALLEKERENLDAVINLKVREETILRRLPGRLVCSECGKVYQRANLSSSTQRCPSCGAPLLSRTDDVSDTLKKRIEIYLEHTHPLIDYYKKKGILQDVSGEGNPQEVFDRIVKILN